jgi:rhomboid protease GluP
MVFSGVHFLSPEADSLLQWGANHRSTTLAGETWRLLTSTFIHIGILHLVLNMYALHFIGILLEPYLGKVRFLAAYIMTGIVASIASIWWQDNTVSAGASGAIFGMYGVFLALLISNLLDKTLKQTMLSSILLFVGYNILYGIRPDSGIDNAAHIGGLLSGMAVGFAFIPSLKNRDNKNLAYYSIGGLALLITISGSLVLNKLPQDLANYQRQMERFGQLEEEALSVFNLPDNTPSDRLAHEYQTKGIRNWKECIKITDEIGKLDLAEEIQIQNELIRDYCEARLKFFELAQQSLVEQTNQYDDELMKANSEIERLLKELGVE